jgi:DNA-directed RNA polymerase specialized sigma24 family protein
LVDGCFAGDEAAWRELHRTYYPIVRTVLHRLGIAAKKMDAACREVFERLLRELSGFERRHDLGISIYRLALAHARRLGRAPGGRVEAGEADMARRVAAAVGAMRGRRREVFVLYELELLPGDQVARVLGCTEATVWSVLHEARQEFERLVAPLSKAAQESGSPKKSPRPLVHRGDPVAEGLLMFGRSADASGEREAEAFVVLRRRVLAPPRGGLVAVLVGVAAVASLIFLRPRPTEQPETPVSARPAVVAKAAAEPAVPAPAVPQVAAMPVSATATALPRERVEIADHGRVTLSDGAATIRTQGEAALIELATGTVSVETTVSEHGRTWVLAKPFTFIDVGTSYTVTTGPKSTELKVTDGSVEVWRHRRLLAVISGPAGAWTSADLRPPPPRAPKGDAGVAPKPQAEAAP